MRQLRECAHFNRVLVVGVAALLSLWVAGTAAGGTAPIAEVRITPGGVDWLPAGENRGFTLSVAGPQGFVVWREFAVGEIPTLSPFDGQGRTLPDGVYGYELRAVDPAGGEGVLAGYLAVRDGSFVVMPTSRADEPSGGDPRGGRTGAPAELTTIPDDLVVEGNACIGIDCTASDVFTNLTLKSSLPYIFFDDTPALFSLDHDWEILINDSVGSGEYFAVEDVDSGTVPFRIEAGAPTSSVVLGPTGNLGLGTAIPATRLHLFSGALADAIGGAGPSPATGPGLAFGYGGASFGRGVGFLNARPDASSTAPNPSLRFLTADVQRMIVTNTGRVGIGTSAPEAVLDVQNPATTGPTIQLKSDGYVILRQKNGTTGEFVDINYIDEEFRINFSNGLVGPELRLTPDGDLIISGDYTPDYVFAPDYALMPLAELGEFVARERHLPNVPNADEVAKKGIVVNDFPMQLLEKIEELTLYTLAQQRTIDELQERLHAVEAGTAAEKACEPNPTAQ